jgi:membrane-associated phospholipid phosphatase
VARPYLRRSLLVTVALAATLFAGMSLLVAGHPEPYAVDLATAQTAMGLRGTGVTEAMRAASFIGSTPVIVLQIAVVSGLLLLLHRDIRPVLWLLAAFVGGWILSNGFKGLLDRPRPTAGLVEATGASFPSGHATQGTAYFVMLGVVLAETLPRGWRAVGAAVAVVVGVLSGLSRIVLGVHWATDVVGGLALGLTWSSALLLVRLREAEPGPPAEPVGR